MVLCSVEGARVVDFCQFSHRNFYKRIACCTDLRFRYFDALKKDEGDRYKLISRYLQTKKKSLVKNWSRKNREILLVDEDWYF